MLTCSAPFKLNRITVATLMSLALVGCGSGGGGSGAYPPSAPPDYHDTTPPEKNPQNPLPPERWGAIQTDDKTFLGQTAAIGADKAHAQGITGKGVTVGVIDTGIYTKNKALDAKSIDLYTMQDSKIVKVSPDAPYDAQDAGGLFGHGTAMSQLIAGQPIGFFQGGVAPDADLIGFNAKDESGTIWMSTVYNAMDFLSAQGADIINISLNQASNAVPTTRIQAIDDAISRGTLLVIATGNDNWEHPGYQPRYPIVFKDAKRGIIAATALEMDEKGEFTRKMDIANACGITAQWCLSAPGEVKNLMPQTDETHPAPGLMSSRGTSNAAAIISGGAALVKSAFPWMNNDNLRQTLLTTADYIPDGTEWTGNPYNYVYGWGRLNVAKAIKGPGQLYYYFDEFVADVTGTSTFSNDIFGGGALRKQGLGTLILAGNNTYTGDTTIENGTLQVNGLNSHSHFKVESQGRLTGTGSVAQLTNSGTVQAQASGSMRVTGDYVQTASGIFVPVKDAPLIVDGNATLAGQVDYRNYSYVSGTEQDTVIKAGSLTLDGLTVQAPAMLEVTHNAVGSDLVADIKRKSASEVSNANTSGDLASAKQLDAAFDVADTLQTKARLGLAMTEDETKFVAALNQVQNLEHGQGVLSAATKLSVNSYAMIPSLMLQAQRLDTDAVKTRLGKVDMGLEKQGSWVTAHHAQHRFSPEGYHTARTRLTGLQMGYDKYFGNWLVGGFASYLDARSHFDSDGGTLDTEKYGVGVYAKRNFGRSYLHGLASLQAGSSDFSKTGLDGNRLAANPDFKALSMNLESGHRFTLGQTSLTPFVGLSYNAILMDQVHESGSALALSIDRKRLHETAASVGVRFNWRLHEATNLGLSYQFDRVVDRSNSDLTARFNVAGDVAINVDGPQYGKNRHTVGLHAQHMLGDKTRLTASFSHQSSKEAHSNNVFLGIKHAF